MPAGLDAQRDRGPTWAVWLDGLRGLVAELLEEWQLVVDGPVRHGRCAIVVSVRTPEWRPAVLKISVPDEEHAHEHLALQYWHGDGAVQLLRADPRRYALLLERLRSENLNDVWDVEACGIVAGLYARLHRPAPASLRPLTGSIQRWNTALAQLPRHAPLPRRLVEQGVALGRDLATDPASTGTIVHTDLHYENVLAGDRLPWLAIDPKPVSGDRHYEVAPMLWNRWDELAGQVREGVRRRFFALVDAAELDEQRARAWVVVRMLHNAMWELQETSPDPAWLTTCVAIAKAVQD